MSLTLETSLFRTICRILLSLVALAVPVTASAQEHRYYAGWSFSSVFQRHSEVDDEPLGGKTWGVGPVFGVQVSPRVGVEVESWFDGSFSWEYSYKPSISRNAHVVASRWDAYFSPQVRLRLDVIEPVVGLSYAHGFTSRTATADGFPYFADGRADRRFALVTGVDAPIRVTSHVNFVPIFRIFASPRARRNRVSPLGDQTRTGQVRFRYGAGVRVRFSRFYPDGDRRSSGHAASKLKQIGD